MQIAVVYSLPSTRMMGTAYADTDGDTEIIAEMVAKGLAARGYKPCLYPIAHDQIESISQIKADCIFNLIEWCGQDIELAKRAFGEMRRLNIPVTGSSEDLFVLTGDKIRMKAELQKIAAPTPSSMIFVTGEEVISDTLKYPVIVKPSLEHCSTGLGYDSIAGSSLELREIAKRQIETFSQSALAEEFVVGREFLVYLLEEGDRVRVLPIEEMIFGDKPGLHFQTYETKWDEKSEDYNSTDVEIAKISKQEQSEIESVCIDVFKKMGFFGYARFDVRYRDRIPYILETNANPSVYDAAEESSNIEDEVIWGIKFPDYLHAIVESALDHFAKNERI